MKETLTDLKNRRSVKAYRSEQISDEELMEVIEAGMNAPSGGNRQSAVPRKKTDNYNRACRPSLLTVSV